MWHVRRPRTKGRGTRAGAPSDRDPTTTQWVCLVDGRPYPEWLPVLKELRKDHRDQEALSLLWKIIKAMEDAEKLFRRLDQPPGRWLKDRHYEQVADLYRHMGAYDREIEVLERYQELIGWRKSRLSTRLDRARLRARDTAGYN
ncbi:hypothetical protein [Actinocorallia longicatena]|uniref:Bacterial transcriptional activator domain-containing protein n=1 Tax=Actinocorallia longicatena TaxID=111803 RepID=A0ABP6Q8L9_9ACTN